MMLTLSSFFSTKLFGRGLVMEDHYGRVDLRLIPISCPLVLVSSMLLLAWPAVVCHWLRVFWNWILQMLTCGVILELARRVVLFFKKSGMWHVLV